MTVHTSRRRSSARSSYRSFMSNLDALLHEAGIQRQAGSSRPVAGEMVSETRPDPVVGRVQTFVDEHLASDLTVDRLAAVADMSPSSLTRRFKARTDTSPWRYVVEQRVEKAKRLLARTDRSLASIAVDTGFYDQAHLTRTFKRLEDQTPGTYRDETTESEPDAASDQA